MEPRMNKHTKKKRNPVGIVAVLCLLAILIGVGCFIAWKLIQPEYNDRMEPNAVVGSMPGKTEEQIQAELNQKVKDSEVAFSINAAPVFETGTSKGNLLFENPTSNKKLTRIEIYRDDTNELIYKSGLLQPGSYIPEAKLKVDLEPGEYVCTAYIYAYKLKDESFVGKVAAGLTITVEN